ncbi:MAG: SDR family NAD(P)-dependent oxidoreductase [Deltaproteobacteria bacterium]|nr:SDR family NAD(P)-dependent oxidoreductase [Deltaproteobacteria bacterium]
MASKKTMKDSEIQSSLQKTPIAIIGMSSIFPKSKNIREYWDNILHEADCISEVPANRWSVDEYYDPDSKTPDKTYCKKGGFIPEIDFDPMEFGLPPNILEVTDVSQLLSLVLAKEVLNNGGYGGTKEFNRETTGVILGVGGGQKMMNPLISRLQYPIWDKVLKSSGIKKSDREILIEKMKKAYVRWEENSFPGTLGNVISGRITNRLDLGGTNCVVDAACASSLSGVRMAVAELLERRCDMMITGGVDTDNSIYMYMCFSKTPAFTKNEKVQPFDGNSAGIMIGEGIGMLLLKRLEDAERDNDRIYAVIKGIGSSSDGKFKSIYAPRSYGQGLALNRAYNDAGIDKQTIGLIEAHGTGTIAGDLAEFNALNEVFSENNATKQNIALGSVKSQIGHTKNAAGAASLVKIALSLYHKVLPATINVDNPNPEFKVEDSPFYINRHTQPWIKAITDPPRRAGVSAFGFGGTNFHFVLEEYPKKDDEAFRLHKVTQALTFSAETPQTLLRQLKEIRVKLTGDDALNGFYELAKQSKETILSQNSARLGFVADHPDEAVSLLDKAIETLNEKLDQESFDLNEGIHYQRHGIDPKGKVVALFSGQGSPYLNMGKELVWNFPPLMESYAGMDELMNKSKRKPISRIVYTPHAFNDETLKRQTEQLQLTENAQPAIGVFSMGLYKILKQAGFKPDFTAGHSFGELTALWAAESISDEDYLMLAKARGEAMAAPDDPDFDAGSMMAVLGKVGNLEKDLKDFKSIKIANYNSNKQVVIAGPKEEILKAQDELKKKRYSTVLLQVSAAFHTPLVGHAQKPFAKAIKSTKFSKPSCPVYSNASGKPYPNKPAEMQEILKDHILNSVNFTQEIENLHQAGGYFFIEFGPQNILTKLTANILKGKPHIAVALNGDQKQNSDRQFRSALTQLKIAGIQIDDFDPFEATPIIGNPNKSALSIKLDGSNYVSQATKKAFEDALNDGFQVQIEGQSQNNKNLAVDSPSAGFTTQTQNQQSNSNHVNMSSSSDTDKNKTIDTSDIPSAIKGVQNGLSQFHQHQSESLSVHEKFLSFQSDYAQQFFNLMNNQIQFNQRSPESKGFSNEMSANIKLFQSYQDDTLRVHENYLKHQADYARASFELIQQQHALLAGSASLKPVSLPSSYQPEPFPVDVPEKQVFPAKVPTRAEPPIETKQPELAETISIPEPVTSESPSIKKPAITDKTIIQALFEIVSDKTGYMQDMLELDMDMEADLGIDSIKRVEILYGIQEKLKGLPEINPEELADLRTLKQIADYMIGKASENMDTQSLAVSNLTPVSVKSTQSSGYNSDAITQGLMEVVSDKTGYPVNMLNGSMDMEADLGIDSIKRVEILYGIQEKLKGLPEINPEDLAELRTLSEIIVYLAGIAGASQGVVESKTSISSSISDDATLSIDNDIIQAGLMEVVSDKTGYPVSMLNVQMDMEADLGIDSIKRVEILYGIQEKLPGLPEINPEDLAELRTLGQIIEYLFGLGVQTAKVSTPNESVAQTVSSNNKTSSDGEITEALYEIISDKTGYMVDMLERDMDLEADLGIDSIKRVEILYALQESLRDLPTIDPDDLADLRTLGQIIDKMVAFSGASLEPDISDSKKKKAELARTVYRKPARLIQLPPPDRMDVEAEADESVLITNDGTKTTSILVESLLSLGFKKIAVLNPPKSYLKSKTRFPESVFQTELNDFSEKTISETLALIKTRFGLITSFIHLHPIFPINFKKPDFFDFKEKAILKFVFFMAKHLKVELTGIDNVFNNRFLCFLRLDGKLGLGDEPGFSTVSGGFFGLLKTLNVEWGRVFIKALDVHPKLSPATAAEKIIDEFFNPDHSLVEVGYHPDGRYGLSARKDKKPVIKPMKAELTPEDVFIVSGGARGVTSSCVKGLSSVYPLTYVLLGRSPLVEDEPEWTQGCCDEVELKQLAMNDMQSKGVKPTPKEIMRRIGSVFANREIKKTLDDIEISGAKAYYVQLDITDPNDCEKKLKQVEKEHGKITGLIHGAGVIADKLIEKKTEEDFENVFNTKILGLHNILRCINQDRLKSLILFSSAAGFYGNMAQSDYALSNEILNKTGHLFKLKYPHCNVSSINWGPWDGGMVTDHLKALFQQRGIDIIPVDEGSRILVEEISPDFASESLIVVGSSMVEPTILSSKLENFSLLKKISPKLLPFVFDHKIGGVAVIPMTQAAHWMVECAERLYPGYYFYEIRDLKVLKGIILDKEQQLKFELKEQTKSEAQGIEIIIKISSGGDGSPLLYHYNGIVHLKKDQARPPKHYQCDLMEDNPISGQEFYNKAVLFHGPSFKGIDKQLSISRVHLTLSCQLQMPTKGTIASKCNFNPFTSDLLLQAMLIWARHFHNAASLPLKVDKICHYKAIPFSEPFFISLKVKSDSPGKMTATITAFDINGDVFSEFDGAEVTISDKLNQKFVPHGS